MPARSPKSKTVRIGHISIALLPGEKVKRIEQISREVREAWHPSNIVEEFDCDTIVHARFKLERYERFFDHFVRSGIKAEDIRGAESTYHAAIRTAERSLEIAREGLQRKPPARATDDDLAAMPVQTRVQ
ncbi:MAG TPA: hypothetical protein VFQ91_01690 [Bryobacteraceae bacterium]|nr:hypothetical protein [Bryobacteraceae bacterium]